MGELIQTVRWCIQVMRRSEPRYAFEHFVVNILLGLVCLVLALLGEPQLWAMFFVVLTVSLAVQGFQVWRLMRRQDREREERLRQAMEVDDDA